MPVAFLDWRVVIVTAEITAQKRMEEKAAQFAAVVQSSEHIIIGKTLNGIVTSWNRGAQKEFKAIPKVK